MLYCSILHKFISNLPLSPAYGNMYITCSKMCKQVNVTFSRSNSDYPQGGVVITSMYDQIP